MLSQTHQTLRSDQQFKGMRFCTECDNMLDPREQIVGENHYLQFMCKQCNRSQRAVEGSEVENCVYRTDYTAKAENLQVDADCIKDPTLSRRRDILCKWCQHNEAVSFTQVTKEKLNLIFVCTRCTRHWQKGEGQQDEAEIYTEDSDV